MLVLVYQKRKILEWPFAIALTPEKLEKGLRLQADCSQSIWDFWKFPTIFPHNFQDSWLR